MTDNYAPAHWIPAPLGNYAVGRPAGITNIIIHDTEGSYQSAIDRFADPTQGVSAHYTIRSADGDITQMVHEADTGFHAGNRAYNDRSIGIEHEGYAAHPQQWYTDTMLQASARLVAAICVKYNIVPTHTGASPGARGSIIGHADIPSEDGLHWGGNDSHTDPGSGWPWSRYMQMVQSYLVPPTPVPAPALIPTGPGGAKAANWIAGWLGLGIDGLPIAAPQTETLEDGNIYTVQYFERARFQLSADLSVSRGLVGTELHQLKYK